MQTVWAASCRKWSWSTCFGLWLCACDPGGSQSELPPFEEPELSLAFVPVETRTSEQHGQTLAHMELTGLAFLPGEYGLIAWEKSGRVVHYRRDSDDVLTLLGEFHVQDVEQESDCGLISIALDPAWQDNHFLYAGHCVSRTFSEVTRYRFDPDGGDYAATEGTGVRVIRFGDQRANRAWHNVGAMGFFDDPEHSMWILAGDKRRAGNAQDHTKNLGGILRIIPSRDASGGYEPHPDNPFGGAGSDPELQSSPDLYAWGLRSPWQGARDQQGRIWIGDVGEKTEEINLSTGAGQDFGWGKADGPCNEDKADCGELTDPIVWWGRSSDHRYVHEDSAASPTSARVAWVGAPYSAHPNDPYRGILDDVTLISDICIGFVRAVSVDETGEVVRNDQIGHMVGLSGAAQASDGQVYVTSFGGCTSDTYGVGGGIYRAVVKEREAPPPEPDRTRRAPLVDDTLGPMPATLSESGLFDNMNERTPSARAIVYEPSLQLWSNGSDKQRFVLLPSGERIDNTRRDHWQLPVGTLFVKTFRYADARDSSPVETRIIRRTEDGWDYQVYRWRDGDAYLLPLERPIPARVRFADDKAFDHQIPSRFDCKSCHEHNETVIIGFDELRLNHVLGDAKQTQLEALAARDLFLEPIPEDPAKIVSENQRERAVIGYLHGNCAHCHNASPRSESRLDLTYPVARDNVIGRETAGSGQAAGIRVQPGSPEQSVLFLAFSGEGESEDENSDLQPMPPLGVQQRDLEAIELFRSWINGL